MLWTLWIPSENTYNGIVHGIEALPESCCFEMLIMAFFFFFFFFFDTVRIVAQGRVYSR